MHQQEEGLLVGIQDGFGGVEDLPETLLKDHGNGEGQVGGPPDQHRSQPQPARIHGVRHEVVHEQGVEVLHRTGRRSQALGRFHQILDRQFMIQDHLGFQ